MSFADGGQVIEAVGGEVEVVGDPGAHSGIGAEELVHPVLVAGQDDHQLVAVVLHHLQQDVDRFLALVPGVAGAVQVVGLVDEQHPAQRTVQDPLGLRRGPNFCRARSTSSSATISCTFCFTGISPTRSASSDANTASMSASARSAANFTVADAGNTTAPGLPRPGRPLPRFGPGPVPPADHHPAPTRHAAHSPSGGLIQHNELRRLGEISGGLESHAAPPTSAARMSSAR
jgi:hypothetical protein